MTQPEIRVHLSPGFFSEREQILLESGPLSAAAFRYPSGVCGLRLSNARGQIAMLPFQGQQIWSAEFDGRNLTMKSMFNEPRPTRVYLETYGGFLLHCGATAMGVPSRDDSHPLHGELPNAPYQKAYLVVGEDERGSYLGLGGQYTYTVAFSHNYLAEPLVKLYSDSARLWMSLDIANLKNTEMELMYLAHINFRPVDNGRLVYSAPASPEHVRVRTSIPSHIRPKPGYLEFIAELRLHPEKHHRLAPGLAFDPEVVFFIDYLTDEEGWAHSMQVHPDGNADYVRHRPDQLDTGVRWISRTPDQDALGFIEPATAEPEGYLAEKAKGNLKVIPAKGVYRCEVEIGALTPAEAKQIEDKIANLLSLR
ncbi:MAG TPA: DUF4432 family protein [Anaerolineales bacterium]|nr:DUF4432 family protein [Anaerolineales bacterium]